MCVFKPKKGYKVVEWYYRKKIQIPKEWEIKTIDDVADVYGGNAAPQDDDDAFYEGTIPFVRMQDLGKYHMTNNLKITKDKMNSDYVKVKRLKIIKKGAIIIPRSGSVAMNHRAILSILLIIPVALSISNAIS